MSLLGAGEIRELAAQLDLKPTKKLGQNFVIDPNTIRKIVDQIQIEADELVVEIGPGLGSLTLGVLEKTNRMIVVEIDSRLASLLPETLAKHAPNANVSVINSDALNLLSLPADPSALIANLPYNISVPVLLNFIERFPSITRALVMVQTEVAQRLAAMPNTEHYGSPSVKMAWWGKTKLSGGISRNIFWPVPGVDSSLVYFERAPELDPSFRKATFELVDAAFAQRRKTLRQSLSQLLGSPVASEDLLVRAGIDPSKRGETLGVQDFYLLAREWSH